MAHLSGSEQQPLAWFTLDRKGDCITLTAFGGKPLNLTPLMAQELIAALTHFIEQEQRGKV